MSEAELTEIVADLTANSITVFTLFYSLTFAYVTAAFLAGARLSRFQAVAVSLLYLMPASSTTLTLIGSQQTIEALLTAHPDLTIGGLAFYDAAKWQIFTLVLFGATIALSIYFMYDCRRNEARA
jgi:hypothetical protein